MESTMKITKVCETCREPYQVYNYRKNESRFCSMSCFHHWRKKSPEYRDKMLGKRKRVTKVCEYCGDSYWCHLGREKESRFCCNECYQSWIANTEEGKLLIKKASAHRKPMSDEQKQMLAKLAKERMSDPANKKAAVACLLKYYEKNPHYFQIATEEQKYNHGISKEWDLVKPTGKIITVRNLQKWCKENSRLFEDRAPNSKHPHWARIMRGLCSSYLRGNYYCGWRCAGKYSSKPE